MIFGDVSLRQLSDYCHKRVYCDANGSFSSEDEDCPFKPFCKFMKETMPNKWRNTIVINQEIGDI